MMNCGHHSGGAESNSMNATCGTQSRGFALSGLGVCDHDDPGRRFALPWADLFRPLRGYTDLWGPTCLGDLDGPERVGSTHRSRHTQTAEVLQTTNASTELQRFDRAPTIRQSSNDRFCRVPWPNSFARVRCPPRNTGKRVCPWRPALPARRDYLVNGQLALREVGIDAVGRA